ncbi:MAG: zinc dependent phospholipase C family protein [Bacillota bacterium]|nr:zinc dependent phospholipase C family protein [Bacillota bacterium]
MDNVEKTYGKALRGVMFAVNPFKKMIMKTNCTVHKFINMQAVEILKNEGYNKEYEFYRKNMRLLNEGVTWADQDFKSTNHFYHFSKSKGLYGFSDALTLCREYFNKSLDLNKNGDFDESIFYLGAACHLIQDATVPQHVNNKLLKSHRGFEMWIISKFMTDYTFVQEKGIYRYKTIDEYINNNALVANNTYLKFLHIEDKEERYGKISTVILKEAQSSTAGFLLDFFEKINENHNIEKKNIIKK